MGKLKKNVEYLLLSNGVECYHQIQSNTKQAQTVIQCEVHEKWHTWLIYDKWQIWHIENDVFKLWSVRTSERSTQP